LEEEERSGSDVKQLMPDLIREATKRKMSDLEETALEQSQEIFVRKLKTFLAWEFFPTNSLQSI
jgi:hypothetical protein